MENSSAKPEKGKELLRISELAQLANLRPSTIKYYTDLGLLPYKQEGKRLTRRYEKDATLKRLKEIQRYKDKRYTIMEIKEKLTEYKTYND